MPDDLTIPAGTSLLDVMSTIGWTIIWRWPTPQEQLLHGLRRLLEDRRWEAEKARLRAEGLWMGDD